MSGFNRFKTPKLAAPEVDSRMCTANGCPLRGSISHEIGDGARYQCSHHAFAESKLWPRITEKLHEHAWFIDLMRNLREVGDGKEWREFAAKFWGDESAMAPATGETHPMYLYRLHLELGSRVGARVGGTSPLKPQGADAPRGRGNLLDALSQSLETA